MLRRCTSVNSFERPITCMRLVVDVINGLIARFDQFFASRQRNPADRWQRQRQRCGLVHRAKSSREAATVKAEPRSKRGALTRLRRHLERAMQLAHRRIDDIKTDAASRQLGGFLFGRKTGTQKQRIRPRFRRADWPPRSRQQAFCTATSRTRATSRPRPSSVTAISAAALLDVHRNSTQRRLCLSLRAQRHLRYRGRRSFAPSAAVAS